MFFILSKIFWAVAMPLNALCLLLLAGLGVRVRSRVWGDRIIGFAVIALLFFAIVPMGPLMVSWLERQYERPDPMPAQVDGIIVLGGMFDTYLGETTREIAVNESADRLICFTDLAKRYPKAKLVFTGGSGDILHPDTREADHAREFFELSAIDADRVIYEKDSRNTYENAVFSKEIANPRPGQTWVVITSAFHMPRSVGVFAAQGWNVLPYPCDYRMNGTYDVLFQPPNAAWNFAMLHIAVREIIGLIVYGLSGKSAFILPPPSLASGNG